MVVIVFIPGPQEAEADPYLKTRDQFAYSASSRLVRVNSEMLSKNIKI